uniref:Uncharacterized protein n=1 Tax=Molossus molossus TaxID=27622 RepID=A0A7J8EEC8_MOLMO|nr:hypothetical protein HJG59_008793 [Molossus molossus]
MSPRSRCLPCPGGSRVRVQRIRPILGLDGGVRTPPGSGFRSQVAWVRVPAPDFPHVTMLPGFSELTSSPVERTLRAAVPVPGPASLPARLRGVREQGSGNLCEGPRGWQASASALSVPGRRSSGRGQDGGGVGGAGCGARVRGGPWGPGAPSAGRPASHK